MFTMLFPGIFRTALLCTVLIWNIATAQDPAGVAKPVGDCCTADLCAYDCVRCDGKAQCFDLSDELGCDTNSDNTLLAFPKPPVFVPFVLDRLKTELRKKKLEMAAVNPNRQCIMPSTTETPVWLLLLRKLQKEEKMTTTTEAPVWKQLLDKLKHESEKPKTEQNDRPTWLLLLNKLKAQIEPMNLPGMVASTTTTSTTTTTTTTTPTTTTSTTPVPTTTIPRWMVLLKMLQSATQATPVATPVATTMKTPQGNYWGVATPPPVWEEVRKAVPWIDETGHIRLRPRVGWWNGATTPSPATETKTSLALASVTTTSSLTSGTTTPSLKSETAPSLTTASIAVGGSASINQTVLLTATNFTIRTSLIGSNYSSNVAIGNTTVTSGANSTTSTALPSSIPTRNYSKDVMKQTTISVDKLSSVNNNSGVKKQTTVAVDKSSTANISEGWNKQTTITVDKTTATTMRDDTTPLSNTTPLNFDKIGSVTITNETITKNLLSMTDVKNISSEAQHSEHIHNAFGFGPSIPAATATRNASSSIDGNKLSLDILTMTPPVKRTTEADKSQETRTGLIGIPIHTTNSLWTRIMNTFSGNAQDSSTALPGTYRTNSFSQNALDISTHSPSTREITNDFVITKELITNLPNTHRTITYPQRINTDSFSNQNGNTFSQTRQDLSTKPTSTSEVNTDSGKQPEMSTTLTRQGIHSSASIEQEKSTSSTHSNAISSKSSNIHNTGSTSMSSQKIITTSPDTLTTNTDSIRAREGRTSSVTTQNTSAKESHELTTNLHISNEKRYEEKVHKNSLSTNLGQQVIDSSAMLIPGVTDKTNHIHRETQYSVQTTQTIPTTTAKPLKSSSPFTDTTSKKMTPVTETKSVQTTPQTTSTTRYKQLLATVTSMPWNQATSVLFPMFWVPTSTSSPMAEDWWNVGPDPAFWNSLFGDADIPTTTQKQIIRAKPESATKPTTTSIVTPRRKTIQQVVVSPSAELVRVPSLSASPKPANRQVSSISTKPATVSYQSITAKPNGVISEVVRLPASTKAPNIVTKQMPLKRSTESSKSVSVSSNIVNTIPGGRVVFKPIEGGSYAVGQPSRGESQSSGKSLVVKIESIENNPHPDLKLANLLSVAPIINKTQTQIVPNWWNTAFRPTQFPTNTRNRKTSGDVQVRLFTKPKTTTPTLNLFVHDATTASPRTTGSLSRYRTSSNRVLTADAISTWWNKAKPKPTTQPTAPEGTKDRCVQLPDPVGFCQRHPSGLHKNKEDCRTYFVCDWDKKYRCFCPPDTLFDDKHFVCNWAYAVTC